MLKKEYLYQISNKLLSKPSLVFVNLLLNMTHTLVVYIIRRDATASNKQGNHAPREEITRKERKLE